MTPDSSAVLRLSDLKPGQCARVVAIDDDGAAQRLMEMGLTEDEELELVRRAPLGDPLEIFVRGSALSVRKTEAMLVRVELIAPSP